MRLNNIERIIVGGLVAVVNFLQLETSISHAWHIIIVAVSTFLSTVFITQTGDNSGIVSVLTKDEVQDPKVTKARQ